MEFRLLGPIELVAGGQRMEIGGPRQRNVLAALAIDVGRPVMIDMMVDRVWGQAPPARVRHSLQIYIARLRGVLQRASDIDGTAARLVHRSGAYLLDTDVDGVDAHRFLRLIEAARGPGCPDRTRVTLLREALDLWRGEPLSGVSGEWASRIGERWRQQRREAAVRWAEAQLRLDAAEPVVSGLGALLAEYPLVEPLVGAQMRALHAVGRAAEALELYAVTRQRLADELGADPDPDLQELHRAILRGDLARPATDAAREQPARGPAAEPIAPWVPAQLPLDVPNFTGRDAELSQLDAVVDRADRPTSVLISALSGTAGVGKTALAVHWAHRMAGSFPDGQLYVDLQGYTPHAAPLSPQDALGRFLRALGVPGERVPVDTQERAALYRSMLDGRRVLVLLDNAAMADQVRPLLPGSAGSVAIVTSRDDLRGLVALHGARPLALDTLSPREARSLLARILGADRVGAEPDAVDALANLCAHLPLALRIAAANLLARPRARIADYVAGLRAGDPLAALSVDDDVGAAVRLAFDRSYTSLPGPARRLFRLLGLVPGRDITVAAAAALADLSPPTAAELVDRLARAHLVAEPVLGRFTFHDLLRRYARDRATAEDDGAERGSALARLLRHYLHTADSAARQLYPQLVRLPYPETECLPPVALDDARAWLETERPNLVAAVLTGARAEGESAKLAWRLADALRGYFWLCRGFEDWLTVAHAASEAAAKVGDLPAQVLAHLSLGVAYHYLPDYQRATEHHTAALELCEHIDWPQAQAAALGNLAQTRGMQGDLRNAVDLYRKAVAVSRHGDSLAGRGVHISNLGQSLLELGRPREALGYLANALTIHQRTGSRSVEAYTQVGIGHAYLLLGDYERALVHIDACRGLSRQVGNAASDVLGVYYHARICCIQNRLDEATQLVRQAFDAWDRTPPASVLADLHNVSGDIAFQRGQYDRAAELHVLALHSGEEANNVASVIDALLSLAGIQLVLGRPSDAHAHADRVRDMAEKLGYRMHEGQALTMLAAIALRQGDPTNAVIHAGRGLQTHRETGHRKGEAETELLLGCILRDRDDEPDAALAHWRRAVTLFREMGVPGELRRLRRTWPTCSG